MLGHPRTDSRWLDRPHPRIRTSRRRMGAVDRRTNTKGLLSRRISRWRMGMANHRVNRRYRTVVNRGRRKGAVSLQLKSRAVSRPIGLIFFVGGVVKGFVKGFKNLVSSSNSSQQQQQQQQQTKANPTQTQQPPDDTPNPAQNTGIRTTPLMLTIPSQNPTNGSTSNQTDKKRLGPFNGAYPISPPSPTDGNTKPRLGPFNGAYPISPPITVTNSTSTTSKRWSPGTSLCNLPPETKEPASSQNEKPRLGPFNGAYPISPPSPTDKDTGNQSAKQQLGPFNGAYPSTPLPTLSTSPGSSVQRVSSDTSQGSTQETKPEAVWSKMTRSVRSSESLSYASEHENPYRDPGENEEEEDGEEEYELVAGDADTQSIDLSVYPPSTLAPDQIGICRLDGCSKPTFVDSITDLESEYCSLEHHE